MGDSSSIGKFFGHPIHIMLIHFPSALFPFALFFDILYLFDGESVYLEISKYSIWCGVTIGSFASIFGVMDLLKIKSDSKANSIAITHAITNFSVVFVYLIIGMVKLKPEFLEYHLWVTASSFVTFTFMVYGNFLGGQLVLKYRIGTEKN
ncbi:MAG: DUF2231 domain-containing protein [Bacteroidota bacterium]